MPTPESTVSAVGFEGVCPIVRVTSVTKSVEYYVHALGFKIDWQTQYFVSVSRDRCHIFLSEGDQGNPDGWVWIGVEDSNALHEEYQRSGAKIRHPPTNYPWACEMQVEDLDGNILRMGSDSRKDEPFGEWLDMYGKVWPPQS
jgi:predicted enzyme related to lactoylglutathione lyase